MSDDIYLIDWVDSMSSSGWKTSEQIDEYIPKALCQSAGFFVKETKDFIVLALSRDLTEDNSPFADLISIPKVAILKRKKIR